MSRACAPCMLARMHGARVGRPLLARAVGQCAQHARGACPCAHSLLARAGGSAHSLVGRPCVACGLWRAPRHVRAAALSAPPQPLQLFLHTQSLHRHARAVAARPAGREAPCTACLEPLPSGASSECHSSLPSRVGLLRRASRDRGRPRRALGKSRRAVLGRSGRLGCGFRGRPKWSISATFHTQAERRRNRMVEVAGLRSSPRGRPPLQRGRVSQAGPTQHPTRPPTGTLARLPSVGREAEPSPRRSAGARVRACHRPPASGPLPAAPCHRPPAIDPLPSAPWQLSSSRVAL